MARDSSMAKVRELAMKMPDTLRAHIERRAERMTATDLVDVQKAITGTADHWHRVVAWWPDGGAFLFDLLVRSESLYSAAGGDESVERAMRYRNVGAAARKLDKAAREFRDALEQLPAARTVLDEAGDSLSVADHAAALEALRALAGGRWRGQLLKALTVLDGTANEGMPVGSLDALSGVKVRKPVRKSTQGGPARVRYTRRSVVDACCRWELREQQAGRQVGDWPMAALSAILSTAGAKFAVTADELDGLRRELRKAPRDSRPD